jgi:2-dehydro-3-deoxygalactonokinase
MEKFISCDWGTSSFRLRLIETASQTVLAEVSTGQGIAAIYTLWNNSKMTDRFSFYSEILSVNIITLQKQYGQSLTGVAVVVSGMASSGIGMLQLPYKKIPFDKNGEDLLLHFIPASVSFTNPLLMVSGVCSLTDVLRGEETILAGCDTGSTNEEMLFIFPGTHSKHLTLKNGIVVDFDTYMTGEIFDLLVSKSILSASVQKEIFEYGGEMEMAFKKGVLQGCSTNLLNSIFHARTNQLFNYSDKDANYYFLSGLLIGTELKEITAKKYTGIQLVASGTFSPLYKIALETLGITGIQQQDADTALIKGQSTIFKRHNNTNKKLPL